MLAENDEFFLILSRRYCRDVSLMLRVRSGVVLTSSHALAYGSVNCERRN